MYAGLIQSVVHAMIHFNSQSRLSHAMTLTKNTHKSASAEMLYVFCHLETTLPVL